MRRFRSAFFACTFIACGLAASARTVSQEPQTPVRDLTVDQIIGNLVSRNSAMTTFQAHISIHLHSGIPFLNPTFEGITYFKRPDRYEVVFTKAPSYAKNFQNLYTDIGDPAVWYKKFSFNLAGVRDYHGHEDIVLRLVERVRGSLDHEDVLVDPRRWVIDEMDYSYYSGGRISVEQTYRTEGSFAVIDAQHVLIAMPPFPRARAEAKYSAYLINVAIDDSVFTKEQTKNIGVDNNK
jgi:hypothetical protein